MRRLFLVLLVLLGAALLAVGWYAYDRGFTRKWRNFVAGEFRQRGVELWLSKLTLDPFRGIIAKNVQLFDANDHRRIIAVVDEMRLVINWANLVQGKTFLDALDLTDANLSLPLDPANLNGPKIDINGLSGRLFLPPQQIYLSRLEADIYGLHLTASGRVINPQRFRPQSADPGQPNPATELAAKIIEQLRTVQFSGAPPQVDLHFSGDLAEPDKLFVEATLWAEHLSWQDVELDALYLDAGYRDGRVEVRKFTASDSLGTLRVSGEYDVAAKAAALHWQSTLDPAPLVRALTDTSAAAELAFRGPPALGFTARATLGPTPSFQLLGHIAVPRFVYRGVEFESAAADFSWYGDRWCARDVRIVHHSGKISGDILQLPGDARVRIKSTINPKIVRPLLTGPAAEWFSQFDFADPATIEAEARGTSLESQDLSARGEFKLGRTSFRGVPADSVTAKLRYAERKLAFSPFTVTRPEGTAAGALVFDFARDEVRIEKVRTSLHPADTAIWVGGSLIKDIAPYRFGKVPPNLAIDGVVHTKGGATTKLVVEVDAPGGMDYTFLKRDLHFPQLAAKLSFTNTGLKIDDLTASLLGGRLRGDAEISLVGDKPGHTAAMRLENVDFQGLTKLYFDYDNAKGRLNGVYNFSGKGDDARTMQGRGNIAVTDGDIFAIPFLGPLSGVLNSIVTGMGSDVAHKATAEFSVGNGTIKTDDLVVEANSFSMIGNGTLGFLDDQMDFSVRVNARGLPGVLLFPVSKLFEYVADDKLSKPHWRPKALPKL